jgi:hypothetical protein
MCLLITNKNITDMKLKIQGLLFSAIALMSIFTACDDTNDLGTAPRLFTPIMGGDIGGTWIKATWDRYEGTQTYNLQLADDSLFVNVLENVTISEEQKTEYTFEGLWYNTQYYIRIQGLGAGDIKSYVATYGIKTLKLPTKLQAPASSDCIDTQVKVKWTEVSYDYLQVYLGKELVKTIDLTADDNAEKTVIIQDLEPSTTYTIHAYQGEEYAGEMDYKTAAAQIFEGNYVDLRGLDAAEAYTKLTQSYIDELAALYPDGFTVVLEGGMHYELPSLNLSTNFNLVTGLSFLGNAILESRGSFNTKSGVASLNSITFENLIFTEHATATPKGSGNYGGQYICNINQPVEIGTLKLIGCDIRYKRGVIRTQAQPVLINTVSIDNCFIDSIGGYGIVNVDINTSSIKDVIVKNSTIAHADVVFVGAKPTPVDAQNSLTLENLTFYYSPNGGTGRYIIDYNGQTLPGGLTIKNCIVGKAGTAIRGMRSAAANINVDNNFRASDMAWFLIAGGEPEGPIDLTALSETTDKVFADPENLNFKVTNAALVNKVGDPRWW